MTAVRTTTLQHESRSSSTSSEDLELSLKAQEAAFNRIFLGHGSKYNRPLEEPRDLNTLEPQVNGNAPNPIRLLTHDLPYFTAAVALLVNWRNCTGLTMSTVCTIIIQFKLVSIIRIITVLITAASQRFIHKGMDYWCM